MALGTLFDAAGSVHMNHLGLARQTNMAAQWYTPFGPHIRDVGYVTDESKMAVWLWNGTAAAATFTRVIPDDPDMADGIEWDATPPDTIPAQTSERVVIVVTIDGPLVYTAILFFESSCLFDPSFTITGTRAPHLSGDVGYLLMPHNWEDGFDESLAWKTDVLIAYDRTEQRVQLRTMPRRAWDLRLLVEGAARRKVETWLGLRKTRYLFSPVWRDEGRLTTALTAGQSVIYTTDPELLDYEVGRWVVVASAWDHFEIRTITGIGASFVAVDAPFAYDWPLGSWVAPARYGVALEQRRLSRFTDQVAEYFIRFEAANESLMPSIATPETYRSVLVCPFTPSWDGGEETIDNKWVRLDNDTGLLEYDLQSIEPVLSRDARFLVTGRADIDLFLRFLFYCRGRLAPFWLPATDRSFELVLPAADGASSITIASIAYEYALSGSPARSHVELVTTAGTIIRRMITGVETQPDGSEKLNLDSPLPQALSAATLDRCCWLEQCRLESDAVDLKWFTGECVEATMPIVVLP